VEREEEAKGNFHVGDDGDVFALRFAISSAFSIHDDEHKKVPPLPT
jgi:hypothetical protein